VDLSNYTAHLRTGAGAAAIDVPAQPSRLSVTRRPGLEMPLTSRIASAGNGPADGLDAGEVDLTLELDVPAFLRRQGE
jgi:hypothetical protein